MYQIEKSTKLNGVCYDIRGPALQEAKRLEEEGYKITKLNIGNPAPFGFDAPEEILQDVILQLPDATGYCDSKGIFAARKAIMQYTQKKQIANVSIEDIYIGNGVSELIMMATQALLNNGDEVLIPAPDYPLWTAAVNLSGGKPIHYLCDESIEWQPALDDLKSKITSRTKALVIINPNNPTGACYSREMLLELLEIARQHKLVVFSDEIYDKILFDDAEHLCTASLAEDLLIVTFNGISKSYRAAGFRSGWLIVSGNKKIAKGYISGLDMLSSMRLCANVPAQYAIQTALGGYQSINDLVIPGGRLYEQREAAYNAITQIPGISCVKPKAALYLFPKIDLKRYPIQCDEKLILDILLEEKTLLVQGSAFNWPDVDHFRIVFLPRVAELEETIAKLGHFFERLERTLK